MTAEEKRLPQELSEVLDRFVEDRVKSLEKSAKDLAKDGKSTEGCRTAIDGFRRDPYKTALKSILGWNPKTGRTSPPKMKIGTHIGKYVSMDSPVTVLSSDGKEQDGFVRSGNCRRRIDFCLNAADMPVAKFLISTVGGIPMYEHIIEGDETAETLCSLSDDPLQTLEDLRSMFFSETGKVKQLRQVYFPVKDGFHLVCPLNGAMMFSLTDILEEKGILTRKDEKYTDSQKRREENGNIRVDGLWLMHFGSTKPQNVSLLGNEYTGNVFMLPSLPPMISPRKIRIPRHDFISECLGRRVLDKKERLFEEEFSRINRAVTSRRNNREIREIPMDAVRDIASQTSEIIEETRNELAGLGYKPETHLPGWQNDMLEAKDGWFGEFAHELAVWIHDIYMRKYGEMLGDDAVDAFEKAITGTREDFT